MFNRLFGDSLDKVRSKADEISKQVTQQAAKAREGITSLLSQNSDAIHLERQLENQATQASHLQQLHDLYVKWVAQIVTSADFEAPLYFDSPQARTFNLNLPLFVFGSSSPAFRTFPSQQQQQRGPSPGDLLSQATWIVPYQEMRSPHNNGLASSSSTTVMSSTGDDQPVSPEEGSASGVSSCSNKEQQEGASNPALENKKSLTETSTTAADSSLPLFMADGLTFRQVFLRSQALETALLSVARLRDVRTKLVGAFDEDNIEASTRGALQRLMALTMRGDCKAHSELLFLFCSVDLNSEAWEVNLRHLVELTALMKVDWLEDLYRDRIAKINAEIDTLKQTVHRAATPEVSSMENLPSGATTLSSLSCPSSRSTESGSATKPANGQTEPSDATSIDPSANSSAASYRIVFLQMHVDQLIQLSFERSKATELAVARRLELLLASANELGQRFASLQTKAVDRSEVAGHENKRAATDLETKLAEAVANKESIDSSVEELEKKRRELLDQLESLELRLAEMLRIQRNSHELVESLNQNKDALKRAFERQEAVAVMVKRESEILQLDMQNMKILVEHAKRALQSREKQRDKDWIERKSQLQEDMRASVISHLKIEIERLRVASVKLSTMVEVLEQLKQKRAQHLAGQSENQRILDKERAKTTDLPVANSSPLVEEQTEEEREVAIESRRISITEFAMTQERYLSAIEHLDDIWNGLSQFVGVSLFIVKNTVKIVQTLIVCTRNTYWYR